MAALDLCPVCDGSGVLLSSPCPLCVDQSEPVEAAPSEHTTTSLENEAQNDETLVDDLSSFIIDLTGKQLMRFPVDSTSCVRDLKHQLEMLMAKQGRHVRVNLALGDHLLQDSEIVADLDITEARAICAVFVNLPAITKNELRTRCYRAGSHAGSRLLLEEILNEYGAFAIINFFGHANWEVRACAVRVIGSSPSITAHHIAEIESLLADDHANVCQSAIETLDGIPSISAMKALATLHSKNRNVQLRCYKALSNSIKAYSSKAGCYPGIREEFAPVVQLIVSRLHVCALSSHKESDLMHTILVAMGTEVISHLVKSLRSGVKHKSAAFLILRCLRSFWEDLESSALEPLTVILGGDNDSDLACQVLHLVVSKRLPLHLWKQRLFEMIVGPHARGVKVFFRQKAAQDVKEWIATELVGFLDEISVDPCVHHRRRLVNFIGQLGKAALNCADRLISWRDDPDHTVRECVAMALHSITDN